MAKSLSDGENVKRTMANRKRGWARWVSGVRVIGVWLCLVGVAAAAGPGYAERRQVAVGQCEAISPGDSQSGLAFNPDGYRSYYVQSECFQKAAVEYRDESLCGRVRRRWSLLWSSWGISPGQCRKLVAEGMAKDRAELEKEKQLYDADPVRLRSFRVEGNGNGRDFDFIPEFSGGYAHGYTMTFEIVDAAEKPILLHSDGYYVDANSRLQIYVRQTDIRARFPAFVPDHRYKVRATVVLSVSLGSPGGYWSDEFVESVFPVRERSQSMTIETKF